MQALLTACNGFLRFTSGATPANCNFQHGIRALSTLVAHPQALLVLEPTTECAAAQRSQPAHPNNEPFTNKLKDVLRVCSDDSCVIDTALDQSYGYDGPVYVWNPGEQFPGQGDLVWKSEDEFSDYDYTDDKDPSRDHSSRDQLTSRDLPRRVPPMFDENAARDMLQ